ncbi:hypothetical protein ENBRE01_2339 [Enteropsectra breve]|nr:hypothetical protein ENBRE01_2339 [Enteropsectra breve]
MLSLVFTLSIVYAMERFSMPNTSPARQEIAEANNEADYSIIMHDKVHKELLDEFISRVKECKGLKQEKETFRFEINRPANHSNDKNSWEVIDKACNSIVPEGTLTQNSIKDSTALTSKKIYYVYDMIFDAEAVDEKTIKVIKKDRERLILYDSAPEYKVSLLNCWDWCIERITKEVDYVQGMDRFFVFIFYNYYKSECFSYENVLDCWKLVLEKFILRFLCCADYNKRILNIVDNYMSYKYEHFYEGSFMNIKQFEGVKMKFYASWFIDTLIFDIQNQMELFNYFLIRPSYEPLIMYMANYDYFRILDENEDKKIKVFEKQSASEWISNATRFYKELGISSDANLDIIELEKIFMNLIPGYIKVFDNPYLQ